MQLDNPTLIGVYIASITAVTSVTTNLITTVISNWFQTNRQKRSELQDIYAACIKSLATVSTLSSATESNMDNIELSLVEAKKCLALLLICTKKSNQIKLIEEEVYLFISGQYEQFLKKASINVLQPSDKSLEKYEYLLNQPQKQVISAADIMLQLIIKIAAQDKRLLL
ncbi:MAG: hypothetical protein V7K72_02685 [Nostoc sp.]|uniref:hypothetical protein n=1 Tax=Nostoc sp. TaxID=1180 RepID=UPI002FF81B57